MFRFQHKVCTAVIGSCILTIPEKHKNKEISERGDFKFYLGKAEVVVLVQYGIHHEKDNKTSGDWIFLSIDNKSNSTPAVYYDFQRKKGSSSFRLRGSPSDAKTGKYVKNEWNITIEESRVVFP